MFFARLLVLVALLVVMVFGEEAVGVQESRQLLQPEATAPPTDKYFCYPHYGMKKRECAQCPNVCFVLF